MQGHKKNADQIKNLKKKKKEEIEAAHPTEIS